MLPYDEKVCKLIKKMAVDTENAIFQKMIF